MIYMQYLAGVGFGRSLVNVTGTAMAWVRRISLSSYISLSTIHFVPFCINILIRFTGTYHRFVMATLQKCM